MYPRKSLKLPITLAVVMIVLLVALTVGWILLTVARSWEPLYWVLFALGIAFFLFVLVGVVMYLTLSIKAINVTRRQSNFIDSVTHELKSPIASLKLYLQTLNRRAVKEEDRQAFHKYMLEDVERLDQLINHLLVAARLEREQPDVKLESVRVDELLRECAEAVCLKYHVPVSTVTLQTEPCLVQARRVDVDLIFRNIVDNAVKYAADQPQVEVTQQFVDDQCVVQVADNGSGIPRRLRRKIFGRFVRLGDELERKKPGTGLGLHIVQTLVARLKGRVRVRDRDTGEGTLFEVHLPAQSVSSTAEDATLENVDVVCPVAEK